MFETAQANIWTLLIQRMFVAESRDEHQVAVSSLVLRPPTAMSSVAWADDVLAGKSCLLPLAGPPRGSANRSTEILARRGRPHATRRPPKPRMPRHTLIRMADTLAHSLDFLTVAGAMTCAGSGGAPPHTGSLSGALAAERSEATTKQPRNVDGQPRR